MRMAVLQARHYADHRTAFGRHLIDQPLMRNTLADLCLESEAAAALAFLTAHSLSSSKTSSKTSSSTSSSSSSSSSTSTPSSLLSNPSLARVITPVAKYYVCKRAPCVVAEALECLGGPGYVDDPGNVLPRLYRDAPLNSIWEGCGNIQALDVLRAFSASAADDQGPAAPLVALLSQSLGRHPAYDAAVARAAALVRGIAAQLREEAGRAQSSRSFQPGDALQYEARALAASLALLLQAHALDRYAPELFAVFCHARLAEGAQQGVFGTLPRAAPQDAVDLLLSRANVKPRLASQSQPSTSALTNSSSTLNSTVNATSSSNPAHINNNNNNNSSALSSPTASQGNSEKGESSGADPILDLFNSFDLNRDGLLSVEELQQGMASLGESFSFEETVQVIARADRDGNKMIDFAEFKSMMGV